MSEINMTPFIDVVLVLLIIFMVTAPLLNVGVEVELPKTEASALSESVEPLVVSMNAQGEVFLQNQTVSRKDLLPRLDAISHHNHTVHIYLRADGKLAYQYIMEIMGDLSKAGYEKLALIGDPK